MCFHKWGKWKTEKHIDIFEREEDAIPVGQKVLQSKECLKCGYIKYKSQRI